MTDTPKLERPTLQVELSDGSTHTITILNPTLVAWDRTRATRKWPSVEEAPALWSTFVTWHHLKATGVVDCAYEEYESTVCVMVGDPPKDTPNHDEVDPTQPTPEPA